jgi:hypothetical protein
VPTGVTLAHCASGIIAVAVSRVLKIRFIAKSFSKQEGRRGVSGI